MIKKIVKLNGDVEDFNPKKVNNWGIWAAETLGDKVDWSSIVMNAVSGKGDTVTSQDLQVALIEECLNKKTYSYYLMAGRLYAVLLRKTLYGTEGIPTIKELHQKMIADRIIVDLGYSDEDYEYLESIIEHDEDLKSTHFSLQYIREKYSLKNRVTKQEYETAQFTYMRMAMALSKDEKTNRLDHVANYYKLFSKKLLSAPTPNYVNLGTVHNGLASCCLIAAGDNGTSLALGDYIANIMTQNSAGIGVNIMSRSIGDPIRDGLIIHQGKKPYIDAMSKAIKANLQNGRGGAGTCFYSAFDPEAEMISQLRNPRSTEDRKNRDLHYALLVNTYFARKAARGEQVFTFNAYTAPDLTEAFYSDDQKRFEELYLKYEQDESFKKNYIDARELLKVSLNEAFETGTAYVGMIDELNRNTPFKEPIYSSNLCVAPSTRILTDQGQVEISTKVDQTVNVWNGEQFTPVTVKKTGENQKLIKVALNNGYKLDSTEYHKWFIKSGSVNVELRTWELSLGDVIADYDLPKGDPSVQERLEIQELLDTGRFQVSQEHKFNVQVVIPANKSKFKLMASKLAKIGVTLWFDYPNQIIIKHSGVMRLTELGFDLEKDFEYSNFNTDETLKVDYIETLKELSDTYCFEEPLRHAGLFNNILTGQCMEIAEPTKPYYDPVDLSLEEDHGRGEIAMCSLGAIAVDNVELTEDPEATYQLASYYCLKMINYCIENNKYPFKHLAYTAKARRSAGVGIMGLATHLAQRGLKYSSEEGKREIHRIAERHMYHLIKASLRLSKEADVGLAPWIHKTKWPEGWLPIDTTKDSVNEIVEGGFKNNYDWEALRIAIKANGGIAHSVLVAYMPGESSSKAVGGTNSIYPARRPHMNKTDNAVVIRWAAPHHDNPDYLYEYAYDVPTKDMIDCYAIFQKFTDQAISADLYRRLVGDEKISSNEMLKDFFYMVKMGMKTRYYVNTETSGGYDLEDFESAIENNDDDRGCASGFCSL